MKKIISTILLAVMVFFGATACSPENDSDIVIFTQTGCPHCENAMQYINTVLLKEMPNLKVTEYNIRESDAGYRLFTQYVQKYSPRATSVGTPYIVVDGQAFIGWTDETQQKLTNKVHRLHNQN